MSAGVYESLGEGTMVVCESVIVVAEVVEDVRGGESAGSEVESGDASEVGGTVW